jgi:GT2 family glycosyltransferase
MALPTVAVIIPTRNRHQLLMRCLSRLIPFVENHSDCSIIVSDDGSALETEKALIEVLPHIQIVQGPRRGPSANRNCGASLAAADLLVFIDDDCIPDQNLIAAYQDAAFRNPQIGVFEGRISADGEVASFADSIPANETGGNLWSCNFAIRREAFLKINGFDERYPFAAMEDIDLHLRVKRQSAVLFLPEARVWHEPEARLGWRIVKHHSLSVLVFLHLYGPKAVGKTAPYFLHMAARTLVRRGLQQIRLGVLRHSEQLLFQVWANIQLAMMVMFWKHRAAMARWFFPPCCTGCESVHATIARPAQTITPLKDGTDGP